MVEVIVYGGEVEVTVAEVKVRTGSLLSQGKVVLLYKMGGQDQVQVGKVKSSGMGRVVEVMVCKGDTIKPGQEVVKFTGGCQHPTIMKDMCAECGADLRRLDRTPDFGANVAMVHAIPELKVSNSEAKDLGREDQTRLTQDRKLVLLVDLDQTLIHTTNDSIPPNLKDVYHFQLYGPHSPWYHTRVRPGTAAFLQKISSLYELHICTFGARLYAHTIAAYLDPDKKFFSHRILSRDECFDPRSKTANMSALFPCGDSMVCIIDDREDVWNFAPNLVHVKPYHFFKHTGDINAPPGLAKKENDEKVGMDFDKIEKKVVEKSPVDFKGKIPKNGDKKEKVFADNIKVNNDKEESSTSEDEKDETKKTEKTEHKRERTDSIDMPLFDSNSRDNHDNNDKVSDTNENVNSKEASEEVEVTEPTESTNETKPISDDLAISDSDESNSKSRNVSDNEDSKGVKSVQDITKSKEIEVEDPDDYLLYLEDILKTVHKAYYDLNDQMLSKQSISTNKVPVNSVSPDLKTVIPYVKRKALAGVHMVFSGVVPTQIPMERSKPFLLARSLGATVSSKVDIQTTHLVAARLGTAKVNDARKQGAISIVTPDWLWACSERWERVCEKLYNLTKHSSVTRRPPAHCSSPEIAFAERCADIDLNLDGAFSRQPSVAEADPFLAFSTEDLAGMDKEVEDILSGESDSDSSEGEGGINGGWGAGGSSSEESLTGESRGHKRKHGEAEEGTTDGGGLEQDSEDTNLEAPPRVKFRRGEGLPSDCEVEQHSDDSGEGEVEGEGEWSLMGAELERELLD
eukprot:GFUD01024971.1.p1 GENE.GFUD01024971.1~~GFUD01024971.1.p1  ORF type:complete len:799 (+),score=264.70 GFUD01024971.1:65-2461(+)